MFDYSEKFVGLFWSGQNRINATQKAMSEELEKITFQDLKEFVQVSYCIVSFSTNNPQDSFIGQYLELYFHRETFKVSDEEIHIIKKVKERRCGSSVDISLNTQNLSESEVLGGGESASLEKLPIESDSLENLPIVITLPNWIKNLHRLCKLERVERFSIQTAKEFLEKVSKASLDAASCL